MFTNDDFKKIGGVFCSRRCSVAAWAFWSAGGQDETYRWERHGQDGLSYLSIHLYLFISIYIYFIFLYLLIYIYICISILSIYIYLYLFISICMQRETPIATDQRCQDALLYGLHPYLCRTCWFGSLSLSPRPAKKSIVCAFASDKNATSRSVDSKLQISLNLF